MSNRLGHSRVHDLLVQGRYLTEAQLEGAWQGWSTSSRTGTFEDYLVDQGQLSDRELTMLLGRKFGIDVVDLEGVEPDPEAIRLVGQAMAERMGILPLSVGEGEITVALHDPLDFASPKAVASQTRLRPRVVLAPRTEIRALLGRLFGPVIDIKTEVAEGEVPGVVVNRGPSLLDLLRGALERRIGHVVVDHHDRGGVIWVRMGSELRVQQVLTPAEAVALVSEVRGQVGLVGGGVLGQTAERTSLLQLGREQVLLSVVILPTLRGERLTLNLSRVSAPPVPLEVLPLSRTHIGVVEGWLSAPGGGVVVVGSPPGESTRPFLLSFAQRRVPSHHPVMILETGNPPLLEHFIQVAVPSSGLAPVLPGVLRQDPSLVVIPDLHDPAAARVVFEAAAGGTQLVVGVQAAGPAQLMERLLQLGVSPWYLAWGLRGITFQRLALRVCAYCSRPVRPSSEEIAALRLETFDGQFSLSAGEGCSFCEGTGIRSKVGIQGMATPGQDERRQIFKGESPWSLVTRLQEGLAWDLAAKVVAGYAPGSEALHFANTH